ncbi:hypothetical protein [Aliarcobacter cryaerophilus]|jgi:mannitol-specific phosphotransferase system IIBC component|uniref:Uncharacterized protein n=1 Tax=Aliarcobacter cryaerophilus TaxID=28198 RepID=A0AA46NM53_9BACT|nr:hypothetical protein [Aliarcobacter cryaerophilus]OQA75704.1 MAG: hypothetical protein BWY33_00659 [Candidatus Dependentiae bacterium ADurb.Bin246]MCT7433463.1 hypothetical protein [Aliarcobacter cryaerophilus]MCT7444039.1 hypothetical protein [Aliarcobacter cryaerophilus]MCT7463307.1 hypothetical protein [Aliarcobacter cryaerophilus]MCT7465018.1 hypothetical protein [Aliarcobacter cryaerophilus]
MFKQMKSALFWYYLYKFRKRAIFIFFLLLVALFSGFIYGDVVEYLKLTQNIEYLKYVLALKWFIIIFNSLLSIYLILTLFKNSENQEKSSVKKDKVETKNSFTQRETELLHKKKLINKAENIIKNR